MKRLFAAALLLAASGHRANEGDDAFIQRAEPALDAFGHRKLFRTCQGCRQWSWDPASPLTDSRLHYDSNAGIAPVAQGGGVWRFSDQTGEANKGSRYMVGTLAGEMPWHNVELTVYAKVITTGGAEEVDLASRSGGTHAGVTDCTSGSYHAETTYAGGFSSQKEVWHTGGYTTTHRGVAADGTVASIIGRRVGLKAVTYDRLNGTQVVVKLYEDDSANGTWTLVSTTVDDGTWGGGSSGCGHTPTDLLLGGFAYVYWRFDDAVVDIDSFTIREIVPPEG